MKKLLIGSLVGAIILFIWGFFAWALSPLHLHTYSYSPVQDSVLRVLAEGNVETGAYVFPMADNRNAKAFDGDYQKESQRVMTENSGKPMATVYYLKEGYQMGGLTMLRGFLFNFLAVLAASIILVPAFTTLNTFFGRWWLTLVIGLLLNAAGPLLHYNWMGAPWPFTVDMVLDNFLNWGITGLWLAWYFRK